MQDLVIAALPSALAAVKAHPGNEATTELALCMLINLCAKDELKVGSVGFSCCGHIAVCCWLSTMH
jgi:hypothetical protein